MVFSTKNIHYYLLSVGVIFTASYFANKLKQPFETNDEYEMIRNYVLNDSPLYGYNRPKLWIHSQYQVNSRKWKSFGSRNSTDLNQPYLHLVIQSIINHCGDDFHICLIDDESFSKLIPSWDVDITNMAEPHKQLFRELAMMKVLYHYGGMIVPNSLLCMKNLKPLYDQQTANNTVFACEAVNKSVDLIKHTKQPLFSASTYVMGSPKNHESLTEIINYLENRNAHSHFTDEYQFKNDVATYLTHMTEMAIAAGCGVQLSVPSAGRLGRLLFAEGGARVVVSVPEDSWPALQAELQQAGCPLQALGRVQADPQLQLRVGDQDLLDVAIDALAHAHQQGLPRRLEQPALGHNG